MRASAFAVAVPAALKPHPSPTPSPSTDVAPTLHLNVSGLLPWIAGGLLVLAVAAIAVRFAASGAAMRSREDRGRLSLRSRLWLRLHPGPGFAREWELRIAYGLGRPRRAAARLRPSLSRAARWLGDPRQYAVYLGVHRIAHRLWIGLETGVLVLGIPRSGKSSWLAGRIIDAPGAVVATSLRGDLVKKTVALRMAPAAHAYRPLTPLPSLLAAAVAAAVTGVWWPAMVGAAVVAWVVARVVALRLARRAGLQGTDRPVWILDPQGVSGHGTGFPFSPVTGCEDAQVARSTAAYMVEAVQNAGVTNAAFWENSATQALRAMLHAAALGSYTLMDVYRWALEADETPLRVLATDPRTAAGKASEMQQFLNLPEETRKGVQKTLANCLDFLSDPRIARSVCSPDAGSFDVDHLISSGGTLYMVADDKAHSTVGPLFAALAGRIMDRAHEIAAASRVERLDPVLTLVLDEVADTCPGPLATWARTSAGWGIVVMAAVHNPDQLVGKWGASVARDIFSSLTTKIAWGGQTVAEHAEMISFMAGTLRVPNTVRDAEGKMVKAPGFHEVPVVTASEVMQLPTNYALVVTARAKPTVVRVERAWRRKDVKAAAGLPVPEQPATAREARPVPDPAARRPVPDTRPAVVDDDLSALLNGADLPAVPDSFGGKDDQQSAGGSARWSPWDIK